MTQVARLIEGFEQGSLHFGIVLGLIALPYLFNYSLYSLTVFQWASLVHNSRLSKDPFSRFKKRYAATAVSMGTCMVVAGALFFVIDLSHQYVAIVIVTLTLILMFGYFVYGLVLASKVAKMAEDKLAQARRFERMVYLVTISMFLSCCSNIFMLSLRRSIYLFFLFSLIFDACGLTAILYMLKNKVRKMASPATTSTSKGSRGGTRRRRTGGGSSVVSQPHSSIGRQGKMLQSSSIGGTSVQMSKIQMKLGSSGGGAVVSGRIESFGQQRGRIDSIEQGRSYAQGQSGSKRHYQIATSVDSVDQNFLQRDSKGSFAKDTARKSEDSLVDCRVSRPSTAMTGSGLGSQHRDNSTITPSNGRGTRSAKVNEKIPFCDGGDSKEANKVNLII
eukprot:jgi/Bigna1/137892/aug1.41_g12600